MAEFQTNSIHNDIDVDQLFIDQTLLESFFLSFCDSLSRWNQCCCLAHSWWRWIDLFRVLRADDDSWTWWIEDPHWWSWALMDWGSPLSIVEFDRLRMATFSQSFRKAAPQGSSCVFRWFSLFSTIVSDTLTHTFTRRMQRGKISVQHSCSPLERQQRSQQSSQATAIARQSS